MASLSKKPAPGKVGDNKRLIAIAKDIRKLEKGFIDDVIKIGELLHEASEACSHGEYQDWLKREFSWTLQTALNYRNVFEFDANPPPQKPNGLVFGSVYDLNISQSALYLIAGMKRPDQQPARLAIIEAAKKGRVSLSAAKQIIADIDKPETELARTPITRTVEVEISHRSIPLDAPVTRLPGRTIPLSPAKPNEPDQETLDRVKTVLDARKRKPAAAATVPAADIKEPAADGYDDLAVLLRRLWKGMMRSYAHDAGNDLEKAIAKVGTGSIREIISWLKKGIEEHDGASALAAKVERAESGRKPKLSQEAIKEMTDRALARSKSTPPAKPAAAADDDLAIPGFLRRTAAVKLDENGRLPMPEKLEPPKATGLDEEALAIDAELRAKKPWLN